MIPDQPRSACVSVRLEGYMTERTKREVSGLRSYAQEHARRTREWLDVVSSGLIVLLCAGIAIAAISVCIFEACTVWAAFLQFGIVAALVWNAALAFAFAAREAIYRIANIGRALLRFSRRLVAVADKMESSEPASAKPQQE